MYIWPVTGNNYYKNVASNYQKMQVAPHSILVARTYGVVNNTIVLILESMLPWFHIQPNLYVTMVNLTLVTLVTGMGIHIAM